MKPVWESRLVAQAFEAAVKSPVVAGRAQAIEALAELSQDEVIGWQQVRLKRIVSRARRFSGYYRQQPYESAFSDFPILTKGIVREYREKIRNRLVPARAQATGGTGGSPLVTYVSHTSFFTEWGYIAYAWGHGGVSLTDPKITFRGSSLGARAQESVIRYQPTYNQLLVSPFHLNDSTFKELIFQLRDFPAKAIWGYPSAVSVFARWVQRMGPFKELSTVTAILLGSESAFDWQLELFREVFDAQVVRWYGQTEKVIFAVGCNHSPGYHVIPTYGFAEIVNEHVIGTGFTNAAMPLIRYNTEDQGRMMPGPCRCGLPFSTIENVVGRQGRAELLGFDNEPISSAAASYLDPMFVQFSRIQFRQTEPGRVLVLVVPDERMTLKEKVLHNAREALQHHVGDQLDIELAVATPHDLLTERGKAIIIDQRYKLPSDDM